MYLCLHKGYQGILGIKPDFDGLRVDPCLPREMTEVCVTRKFRGAPYHIHIVNRAGGEKGALSLSLDGKAISGNLLNEKGGTHEVEAIIEAKG